MGWRLICFFIIRLNDGLLCGICVAAEAILRIITKVSGCECDHLNLLFCCTYVLMVRNPFFLSDRCDACHYFTCFHCTERQWGWCSMTSIVMLIPIFSSTGTRWTGSIKLENRLKHVFSSQRVAECSFPPWSSVKCNPVLFNPHTKVDPHAFDLVKINTRLVAGGEKKRSALSR